MIIVDAHIPGLVAALSPHHDVLAVDGRSITNELLRTTAATTLIIRSVTRVDTALLDGTSVTTVATATTGIDHIDVDALRRKNIRVVSAAGCNAQAVAEYVLDWIDELRPTSNHTIGIIGFGNVGSRLARYAHMRAMRILVNDPPLVDAGFTFPAWATPVTLYDLVKHATIVSVHVPYVEIGACPTRNLLSRTFIDLCQPNTLVINSARGGIVDETALVDRVMRGDLAAVLDVFTGEPSVDPRVLQHIPYCTPHIAGYTYQAKWRGAQMVLDALGLEHSPLQPDIPADNGAHYTYPRVTRATVRSDTDFESLRMATPLRHERRPLPTLEECNASHA